MSSGKYEQIICDAIETLVDKAVAKASYDRTIQATIIEHTDATIGKYKVKYQDSTFYAYATDVSANYSKDSNVYVLIHANDMEKDKTIIGAVEKLGLDYVPVIDDEDAYNKIGENCVEKTNEDIGLCSYKREGIPFILSSNSTPILGDSEYLYKKDSNNNQLTLIKKELIESYIKQSSSLICGATFRTDLPAEQRQTVAGTYGIEFDLAFKDKNGDKVTRTYHIDINDMEGTPYEYKTGSAQYEIFDIDGENFIEIEEVRIFCAGFPHPTEGESSPENFKDDIFITNVLIQGAKRFSEEDLKGCFLSLSTPQGAIFTRDKNSLSLEATLRVKGKVVSSSQEVKYYWFRENPSVSNRENSKFHEQGGLGWECLNKITKQTVDKDGKEITIEEFTPLDNLFIVNKENVPARTARYKAVAIYNGSAFSAEIVLYNFDYSYDISLITDTGATSFNGVETPIVSCVVRDSIGAEVSSNLIYSWGEINAYNQFSNYSAIEGHPNQIKVYMNKILTFAIYKCAVYKKVGENSIFIGTAAIQLKNEESEDIDLYSLVINNGTQVFKYNERGISPASPSLDNPIVIPELSFTLYDPEGNEVPFVESNTWYFPINSTMLELLHEDIATLEKDKGNEYYIIRNPAGGKIAYTIAEKYDPSKVNNTIRLVVTNGATSYVETTTFLFTKEGDSGTNGTDYVLQIIPNVKADDKANPIYAAVNKIKENYIWNFSPAEAGQYLKLTIYKSGVPIYTGTDFGKTTSLEEFVEGEEVSGSPEINIEWVNLVHKYSLDKQDISDIQVSKNTTNKVIFSANYQEESAPADIIQARVSYNEGFYSATAPIITSETANEGISIKYVEGSGFTSVVYSADGMLPQYNDRTPFQIEVKGIEKSENLSYNWSVNGKINQKNLEEQYLKIVAKKEEDFPPIIEQDDSLIFQVWIKPIDRCNAEALNNSVKLEIKDGDNLIAWIRIPVHFLLNKYGQAALNGWDGNSVDVNEKGGYILAPQIGAGKKEEDNSFTGMLMGEVKEYHTGSEISHTGLIGYHQGIKSLFLNAEDGSAIFGKFSTELSTGEGEESRGQIIIDPANNEALLYSSNFFKNYKEDGKPTSTDLGNESKKGLLINLSKPEIRYGNGKFIVDKDGNLTAVNGNFSGKISSEEGYIGGWNIGPNSLYHDGYTVGMGAFNTCFNESQIEEDSDSVYGVQSKVTIADSTSETGIKEIYKAAAFWAGGSGRYDEENGYAEIVNPKVLITHDGYLKVTEASIGAGSNPIFIGKSVTQKLEDGTILGTEESAIYSFKKNSFELDSAKAESGFYLGESGLAIGGRTDIISEKVPSQEDPSQEETIIKILYKNNFQVTKDGELTARKGFIGDGEENGWTIQADSLIHNGKTMMFKGSNKPFNDSGYTAGSYLGVNGFELGRAVLQLTFNDVEPQAPEDDGEESADSPSIQTQTVKAYKRVLAPGFWVRAGNSVLEDLIISGNKDDTNGNTAGQVGINRGFLAGTWKITEKGICSTVATNADANKYMGETKAYVSDEDAAAKSEVPTPKKDSSNQNYYLEINKDDGTTSKIKMSNNNYKVQLLSFCLPNQIDRAIGRWKTGDEVAYAYQRIVAGKSWATDVEPFIPLGAKKWMWELLDDGSMYSRRSVISTNHTKTYDNDKDGIYLGPEGLNVGKYFKLNQEGAIIKGPTPITAIEIMTNTKYNVTTNGGVEYYYANFEE